MNNLCYQFSYDFETNYCFPEIVCLFTLSIKLPQGGPHQIHFVRNPKISLMQNGKVLNENGRNFRRNEVENFVETTSKFAEILNETERILIVHFCEFRSTKILLKP